MEACKFEAGALNLWCDKACMDKYAKCQQDTVAALQKEMAGLRTTLECTATECPIIKNSHMRTAIRDLLGPDLAKIEGQVLELTENVDTRFNTTQNDLQNLQP